MHRSVLKWFFAVVAVYAVGLGGNLWLHYWIRDVFLKTPKSEYYRYEMVPVELRVRRQSLRAQWFSHPPKVMVMSESGPVATIGGMRFLDLKYDPSSRSWKGLWPCPWNAKEGPYTLALATYPELKKYVRSSSFRIVRRKPHPVPERFVVLTFENANPVPGLKIRAPSGEMKDWKGLLDWAQHIEADAFWMLGSLTPGEKNEVWVSYNLPYLSQVGRECHKRGLKFGVWVMCYLTARVSHPERYEYALDYKDGNLVTTRSISIRDPRRSEDIAQILQKIAAVPEVDYVGMDYIRNALGGYELAQDFFREMPGSEPLPGWERLSPEEQRKLFARKKIARKDKNLIDRWQWWRAQKVAHIVKRVREAIGKEKRLWVFTLGWERGWQHGQDAAMMNDAGADVDAVMLYEADSPQYAQMMKDWKSYLKREDVQLIVGDVVDWPLHQSHPDGPGELVRRLNWAAGSMYQDGPVKGIFIHDLARALWGRKGPYSTQDWMKAAKTAVDDFRGSRQTGGKEATKVKAATKATEVTTATKATTATEVTTATTATEATTATKETAGEKAAEAAQANP